VRLTGQYGINDIFVGAPVKLGREGISDIIELKLEAAEKESLAKSVAAVKEVADALDNMNLL
jgi:malate dehydrogenase